jgi:hypothetical protein
MSIFAGHCFCGGVKFQVTGPEKYACFCHCESCQRAAGAVYVPWATFDRETLVVTAGEIAEHHSSPGVTRGFCRECGTLLTYEHVDRDGDIDVTLTSFDDPSQFIPRAHIWVEDKLPWIEIGDDLPQFPQTVKPD